MIWRSTFCHINSTQALLWSHDRATWPILRQQSHDDVAWCLSTQWLPAQIIKWPAPRKQLPAQRLLQLRSPGQTGLPGDFLCCILIALFVSVLINFADYYYTLQKYSIYIVLLFQGPEMLPYQPNSESCLIGCYNTEEVEPKDFPRQVANSSDLHHYYFISQYQLCALVLLLCHFFKVNLSYNFMWVNLAWMLIWCILGTCLIMDL